MIFAKNDCCKTRLLQTRALVKVSLLRTIPLLTAQQQRPCLPEKDSKGAIDSSTISIYGWIPFEWQMVSPGPIAIGNLSPVLGRKCDEPPGRGAGGYAGVRDSEVEPGGADILRRSGQSDLGPCGTVKAKSTRLSLLLPLPLLPHST
jgi:hypothetical protein